MIPTQSNTNLLLKLFLLCMFASTAIFIFMFALQKSGAILLSTVAFVCGLLLMLVSYALLTLLGSALLSYMVKTIHQTVTCAFSLHARLHRQWLDFLYKKETLVTQHHNRSNYLNQKTRIRQQLLHDANTRTHMCKLGKKTHKQLCKQKKILSPERSKATKKAINRCVDQLDMQGLLEINFRLSNTTDTIALSAHENTYPTEPEYHP